MAAPVFCWRTAGIGALDDCGHWTRLKTKRGDGTRLDHVIDQYIPAPQKLEQTIDVGVGKSSLPTHNGHGMGVLDAQSVETPKGATRGAGR